MFSIIAFTSITETVVIFYKRTSIIYFSKKFKRFQSINFLISLIFLRNNILFLDSNGVSSHNTTCIIQFVTLSTNLMRLLNDYSTFIYLQWFVLNFWFFIQYSSRLYNSPYILNINNKNSLKITHRIFRCIRRKLFNPLEMSSVSKYHWSLMSILY